MINKIFNSLLRAYITTLMLLLIFAFIIFMGDVSDRIVSVMVVITYFISTLMAGINIGNQVDKRKYIWGIIIGAIYFMVLFLVSLIGNNGFVVDVSVIIAMVISLIGGMIGGMIS